MASQVIPAPFKHLWALLNSTDEKTNLLDSEMGRYKAIALTVERIVFATVALSAIASGVAITPPLIVASFIISGPATVITATSYFGYYHGVTLIISAVATLALKQIALGCVMISAAHFCLEGYANFTCIDLGEQPADCFETTKA